MDTYPVVDRHYSEQLRSCPDCPNLHHSLYTIGDSTVGRCFICMVLAWHKLRAEMWTEQETRSDAADNQPARQPVGY